MNGVYVLSFFLVVLIIYHFLFKNENDIKINKLIHTLNSMDLMRGWEPGYNVKCDTGERVKTKSTTVSSSHCSCFVYAVCKKMNIKLIGTPEYSQYHLAHNQINWLKTEEAHKHGWRQINGSLKEKYLISQEKANNGVLVIAGTNQDKEIRGHIAIVRPSNKSYFFIINEGPQVISSSYVNTYSSSLKEDFLYYKGEMASFENRTCFFYNIN